MTYSFLPVDNGLGWYGDLAGSMMSDERLRLRRLRHAKRKHKAARRGQQIRAGYVKNHRFTEAEVAHAVTCPLCGTPGAVEHGFGLMGGGYGPYYFCTRARCPFFVKFQRFDE